MLYTAIIILLVLFSLLAIKKVGGVGCLLVLLALLLFFSVRQCKEDEERDRINHEKAEEAYKSMRERKMEYIRKGWVTPPRMNPPTPEELRQDSIAKANR